MSSEREAALGGRANDACGVVPGSVFWAVGREGGEEVGDKFLREGEPGFEGEDGSVAAYLLLPPPSAAELERRQGCHLHALEVERDDLCKRLIRVLLHTREIHLASPSSLSAPHRQLTSNVAPQFAPALLTNTCSFFSLAPNSLTSPSTPSYVDKSAGRAMQRPGPSAESSAAVDWRTSGSREAM